MGNRKGFTLAEMLIVMAMTAIFAAAAIPTFSTQMEIARNKQREVELSAAMTDALLDAMKESRITGETSITITQSDDVVQSFQDFKDTSAPDAIMEVTDGNALISVGADGLQAYMDEIAQVDFIYEPDDETGVLSISSVVIYGANGFEAEFAAEITPNFDMPPGGPGGDGPGG